MDSGEFMKQTNDKAACEELEEEPEGKEQITGRLVDASCQTDFVVIEVDLPELKRRMALSGSSNPVQESLTTESIAAAAQSVLNKSGWVYDPRTGTYFDYNTKLYYYPQTRLYYNYKNGCYYKYNQEKRKYEFHYQLEAFKNRSKNLNPKSARMMLKNMKQTIPTLRKFATEYWSKDRTADFEKKQPDMELDPSDQKTDDKEESFSLLCHKVTAVGSKAIGADDCLSDSESSCMRKSRRKYHLCKKCSEVTINSCCLDRLSACKQGAETQLSYCSDSEIEMLSASQTKYCRCQTCNSLSQSACCDKVGYWLFKAIQLKCVRRKRGGRKRKRKRKRITAQSSDSSLTEKEYDNTSSSATSQNGQEDNECDVVMKKGTFEGNKVEYNFDAFDSELRSEMDTECNIIPCIRAMVTSSPSLNVGELYVITCNGAIIGSDDQSDIQILEDGVSGKHAMITYDSEQRNYFVTDLGSESGTTLNSTTECNPGTKTVLTTPISHKSILLIGSCIFVLHVHFGYETCDDCEPGQIRALLDQDQPSKKVYALSKHEKEAMRRSELKSIKKKYDLHGERYKQKEPFIGPRYTDRAAERRRTVGSDNPYEKDEMPASLETELAEHNKGHQMMKKMGWNKGTSLGKSQKGIIEPIKPQGNGQNKLGLGFGAFKVDDT